MNSINSKNDKLVSLYDFLGKPAGKDLGNQVYQAANAQKIKVETKQVSNPKYTGKVMLYPEWFLISYFNKDDNE